MPDAIIVALITSGVTLAGVLISNGRSDAIQNERIDQLREEMKKYNNLQTRTTECEKKIAVHDAEFTRVNKRLEKGGL